jgi:hypothetical protein
VGNGLVTASLAFCGQDWIGRGSIQYNKYIVIYGRGDDVSSLLTRLALLHHTVCFDGVAHRAQ